MTQKRVKVLVLYGGCSVEHEVSCCSAAFIYKHLDPVHYELLAAGVDKDGRWIPQETGDFTGNPPSKIPIQNHSQAFKAGFDGSIESPGSFIKNIAKIPASEPAGPDQLVVFPLIHGSFGEDGTLQGFLDMAGVAYVGSGTLASSVAMDKIIAKQLVESEGIPVAPWITASHQSWNTRSQAIMEEAEEKLGYPMFVKPACLGSSVGISKVHNRKDLAAACKSALSFDHKILIEKSVEGARELECATLGGEDPECAGPGEVIPHQEFYTYDAKYVAKSGASLDIPAKVPSEIAERARDLSRKISSRLNLYGMARVDLFYTESDGNLYFNEANTIPGFTEISQYPMLWKHAGLSGRDLLTRLIRLAQDRQRLVLSFNRQYTDGPTA